MLFHNGIKFVRRIDVESPMSDLIVLNPGQNETVCLSPTAKGPKDTIEVQNVFLEPVVTYTKENLKEITRPHLVQVIHTIAFGLIAASKDETALDYLISSVDKSIVATILGGNQININLN